MPWQLGHERPYVLKLMGLATAVPQPVRETKNRNRHKTGNRTNTVGQSKSIKPEPSLLPLGSLIIEHNVSFQCYAEDDSNADVQIYLPVNFDELQSLSLTT